MNFKDTIEGIVMIFEISGVIALIIGALFALIKYIGNLPRRREDASAAYRQLRQGLGRAILIGLEFLVAADIIRSIAVDPTFVSVGVLGLIVAVRTFLSWSLEVEINGRWPWQSSTGPQPEANEF
ncbi:MAG TPA: DUF1622 domain-containing protein [Ktedonosporobacter sp.]|jgi:uncharacterized membrane protein|nr:DUF1622 domain-containing protein [Ktedonosporobacter sp.]